MAIDADDERSHRRRRREKRKRKNRRLEKIGYDMRWFLSGLAIGLPIFVFILFILSRL